MDFKRGASLYHGDGAVDGPAEVESLDFAYHLARHGHHRADYDEVALFDEHVLVVNDFNVLRFAKIQAYVYLNDRVSYLNGVCVDVVGVIDCHR